MNTIGRFHRALISLVVGVLVAGVTHGLVRNSDLPGGGEGLGDVYARAVAFVVALLISTTFTYLSTARLSRER